MSDQRSGQGFSEWQLEMQAKERSGEFRVTGKALEMAMREFNANINDLFLDRIWREYLAAGKPKAYVKWLRQRLANEFRCVDKPPVWIGEEPNWAFHHDRPMIFLHQTPPTPYHPDTDDDIGSGDVLYLFALDVKDTKGNKRIIYKIIEENASLPGTGVASEPCKIGDEWQIADA